MLDSHQRAARRQILSSIAHQAYSASEVAVAGSNFKEALDLLEPDENPAEETMLRRWTGACYFESGRLIGALAILAPLVNSEVKGRSHDYYVGVVKYIEAAQEIPIAYGTLQSAYRHLAEASSYIGQLAGRHMELRKLSELMKARGELRDALALARESWMAFKNDTVGPGFLADEYLSNLVDLELVAGNLAVTGDLLKGWENTESGCPSYSRMTLATKKADFFRLQGDDDEAGYWSEEALVIAAETGHHWGYLSALEVSARCSMDAGNLDRAKESVLNLIAVTKNGDSKEWLFVANLLRADILRREARDFLKWDSHFSPQRQHRYYLPEREGRAEAVTWEDASRTLAEFEKEFTAVTSVQSAAADAILGLRDTLALGREVDSLLCSRVRLEWIQYRIQLLGRHLEFMRS